MTTPLYIEELKLSHFRSHKSARYEFDGRPVALFGANGAGKTNILEAISMLSPGRGLRRAPADQLPRKPENLGWKISATLLSKNDVHEIETGTQDSSARSVRIDGKTSPQIALGRIARIVWLIPAMDRLWIEGAEGRRRFLDRMVLSFEPPHADAVLGYEKAMRERNRLLKDMVREPSWYHALERKMAETGAQIMENRRMVLNRLEAAQADSTTVFPTADLSLKTSDDLPLVESQNEIENALSDNRSRDLAAGRTLIGPHRIDMNAVYSEKNVGAEQCSTGEQKALLISLILSNGRALAQDFGAAPIFLLDEVVAHLDQSRANALFDEICALNAQAFMTGTGAELFTALGSRAEQIELT